MSKKSKISLISILSLFFLCSLVFAEYSNDVPTPTVVAPPKTSTPPPAPTPPPPIPIPEEPEQPRIKVTVPQIPDDYETTTPTLTGANVIVRVLESGTKKAISGATVKWYSAKYATSSVTDSRGEAKIGQVVPGDAKITANAKGYVTNSKTVRAKSSTKAQYFDIYLNKTARSTPSSETPPAVTTAPPLDTAKKASISGIVYDKAAKKPISGASVKLTGTSPGQGVINETSSDGNGRYTITDCPLGVAVKLIYSKEGYNTEEMTRYIAKTTASYRQDAYLGKGAIETKKSGIGTTQSALTVLNADVTVISLTVDGQFVSIHPTLPIGDGMHELSVTMRNAGPEDITGELTLTITKDGTSIFTAPVTFETTGRDVLVNTRQPFTPGYYELNAVLTLPEGIVDIYEFNNHDSGSVRFEAADPIPPPAVEPHNVDVEMIDFTIDGQSVEGNPTILKRDGPHELIATIRNNGPDATTDLSYVTLAVDGIQRGPSSRCDTESNASRTATVTWQEPLDLGDHELWASSVAPAMDRDDNFSNNGKRGTVKIVESLPPPDDGGAGGEEARRIDLQLVDFIMRGQLVDSNPTVELLPGNQVNIAVHQRNNGPERPSADATIHFIRDGRDTDYPIGFPGEIGFTSALTTTDTIAPGVYDVEARLDAGGTDVDTDLSNNGIRGRVTFVLPGGGGAAGGRHTDVQLIDFLVEGMSITAHPAIQLVDNNPVNLSWISKNNGPDNTNGVCKVRLTGIGINEEFDTDLSNMVGATVTSTAQRNFTPGAYNVRATIDHAPGDTDDNLDNNTVGGGVAFIAPAGGGQRGAGTETDLEVVRFSIDDQPVNSNPTLEIGDGRHILKVTVRNNGPAEARGPANVYFVRGGRRIPPPGGVNLLGAGAPMTITDGALFDLGTCPLEAVAEVSAGDSDSNAVNNRISGTVTFVENGAGPGPGPDGGQPDGGQPDGGQPGGGNPPGGWNPPGGGAAPRGAGPIVPAIPPQADAGLFGGGVPQQAAAPAAITEVPVMEAGQPSPVVHPQMGSGPEFVKDFIGQVSAGKAPEAKEEEKEAEEPAAAKEKNKILWLIALLSGIGLFIILAVIAKKKKKKNEV